MKIKDRLSENRVNISFEVFPPKTDAGYGKVLEATEEIAALKPSFISVTYGAGGGTSKNTVKIASHIQKKMYLLFPFQQLKKPHIMCPYSINIVFLRMAYVKVSTINC